MNVTYHTYTINGTVRKLTVCATDDANKLASELYGAGGTLSEGTEHPGSEHPAPGEPTGELGHDGAI